MEPIFENQKIVDEIKDRFLGKKIKHAFCKSLVTVIDTDTCYTTVKFRNGRTKRVFTSLFIHQVDCIV